MYLCNEEWTLELIWSRLIRVLPVVTVLIVHLLLSPTWNIFLHGNQPISEPSQFSRIFFFSMRFKFTPFCESLESFHSSGEDSFFRIVQETSGPSFVRCTFYQQSIQDWCVRISLAHLFFIFSQLGTLLEWAGVIPNLVAFARLVPTLEDGKVSFIESEDERWVDEQSESIHWSSCMKKGDARRTEHVPRDLANFKNKTLMFWTVSLCCTWAFYIIVNCDKIGKPKSMDSIGFLSRAKLRILTEQQYSGSVPKSTKVWLLIDTMYGTIVGSAL